MRQKVKRYSRSALSILLTLCMLVSCMTVGIIATDAAKVTADEAVGYSNYEKQYLYVDISALSNWELTGINVSWSGDSDSHEDITNNWLTNKTSMGNNVYRFDLSEADSDYYYFKGFKVVSGGTAFWAGYNGTGNMIVVNNSWNGNTWSTYSPTPYLHYCIGDDGRQFSQESATNVAMTSAGGDTYTYSLSEAGSYHVNIDGNSGKSGTALGITSVSAGTGITGVATGNWGGYQFYNFTTPGPVTLSFNKSTKVLTITLKASTVSTAVSPSGVGTAYVSKTSTVGTETSVTNVDYDSNVYLKATVTNSDYEFSSWKTVSGLEYDKASSASTSATVTANATATAIFLPKKYNITKQNAAHVKVNVPTEVRWDSSVTPTATAEPGYKVDKYQWSQDGGTSWTDLTPGSSFTMPKNDVIVKAVETTCATHKVTFSVTAGNGSIKAVTDDGRTIASGGLVNTGSVVTFTAVPADQASFTSWGGDLSSSAVSPTTLTVDADKNVTAAFGDITYFVASYTNSSYVATEEAYSTVSMSRLNNGYYRSSTKLADNKYFTVGKTEGSTTTYAKCGQDDPWGISTTTPAVTPQHWTSKKEMKSKYKNTIGESYVFYDPETDKIWLSTDPAGFTGVTIFAKDGSLTAHNPGTGTNPDTTCGWGNTTLTVTTGGSNKTVTDVFDSQVHKATLTAAEAQAATTSITVSTTVSKSGYYVYGYDVNGVTVQATNGSATFCPADLDCNISNFIEITPIYMLQETNPNDPTTIRFYVRSFSGEIESRWGGALYCYSYNGSREATNGLWPGQPMVNLGGGTYYMDLPLDTRAITLSNAAADWVHATTMGIGLPTDDNTKAWANRNAYQCQSYDYDDFKYIYAKPGVGENDEDIIFDFKYKQGSWGTAGEDNFPNNQFEYNNGNYSETGFSNTLDPSDSSYQWEKYTDFYDNPVDLWGTKLTSNYNNNPVRVVVQGYYDTSAANNSYYATTYVVYKPSQTTGDCTYSLVDYTDSPAGYGKKSRSEFLQRSAEDMDADMTALAGQPVEITYEYAIYKNRSTINTNEPGQLNQTAERADGVWYYSETKPIKATIKIQYADKLYGAYTDDTFAIDTDNPGTDYDGDPYTVNEGTVTKGKAYFIDGNYNVNTNRPSSAPFNVDYTNKTVEFAYSDGNESYELKAEESPDGEYTFVGWYKETSSGLDKCPPGFTYSMEATTNETFVARYVKAPSGIKLAHKPVVTYNSGGTGERKVKYEIYNNADCTGTPLKTGEENGSIVVDKKYIKYNQNYYLKVTYEAVPDTNSLINGIYSTDTQATANLISEEGFEAHNTYNTKHVNVSDFTLTPSGTATKDTTKVEFNVPINSFFKNISGTTDYEFDEDLALLELFSDFDKIRNNINITKNVDYNNGEKFSFTVKYKNDHDTPENPDDDTWDNYAGKYTVGEDATEHTFTGTITNVSGNSTIHILNAPAGTQFQISENALGSSSAYTYTNNTINGATGVTAIDRGQQFTMSSTGSVTMEFTNNIKKAAVKVKKVVEDGDSGTQAFPITLSYTYPNDGATTGSKNVSLQHNQTTSGTDILTLPVGTVITVTEDLSGIDGYAADYTTSGTNITKNSNGTFTVTEQPSGTNGLITVTNKKLYDVNITKQIVKSASDKTADTKVQDVTTSFKFKIYEEVNSAWVEVTNSPTTRVYQSDGTTAATYTDGAFVITKGQTVKVLGVAKGTKLRVVETDHIDSHYRYVDMDVANATGSTFKWNLSDTANADGTEFTVGEQNVNVTINNTPKRIKVTIKKETDYPDDEGKDGSVFKIFVKTKPYNTDGMTVADASGSVKSGVAPAPITDPSAPNYDANDTTETGGGYYRVLKDGVIEFTDVPVGTFFEVTETYWGHSHVYGTQRFTTDYIHLTKDSSPTVLEAHSGNTDFNNTSTPINEASTFTVRNKVKRASFSIKKEITDKADTVTTHELTVTMLRNGPNSPAQVNGTYESEAALIYRSSLDSSTDVKLPANGKINIHSGEVITFSNLPVGTYVEITETTPNGNYQFDQFVPSGVNLVTNPIAGNTIQLYTTDTNPQVANVIIQNKLQRKTLEITKAVDDNVSETNPYRIRVYTAQTAEEVTNGTWTEYTGALAVKNSSPSATRTHSSTSGSEGYTIAKGETLVMSNIEVNTFVKVVEVYDGEKHEWQSYSAGTTPSTSTMEGGTYFKMDSEKALTITNKLIQRDIDITKTINNNVTDNQTDHKLKLHYAPNGDTTYAASVTLKNGAQTKIVNDNTEFTIKAGETWRLENAPIGAKLIIQESTPGTGYVFDTINVTNAATVTNSEGVYTLTVGTNDVSVDVRNYRVHDVTITKTVDVNTCTEYFPIKVSVGGTDITNSNYTSYTYDPATMPTATGGNVYFDTTNNVFMLKAGQSFKITDIVEGTNVDVLEDTTNFGNNYAYNGTESTVSDNKGAASTDGTDKGFTGITVDENVTVTIANKVLHTVEIKKTTDKATTETFNIQVFVGENTNLIGATGWTVALNNATADSDHYVVSKDGTITISGVPSGTQFKVVEVNGGTGDFKYDEASSTVTGATKTVIDDTDVYGYTFTTAHADVNAVVHNKEAAKYQYEIKYIYEGYSAKTYQNNTNLTDANRVVGENRSYTQTGEISTEDLNTYFDKDTDGKLSFKSDVQRKNFISKFAPYEDDFMLSLVWDDKKPTAATYDANTKTIKLETKAASQSNRTVHVKFKLPYVFDTNLVPTGSTYAEDAQQTILTTQYGNHVTNSSGNYVTAPLTLNNNGTPMYFKYWQIKSDHQNKNTGFTEADSKRCYYASFNMTMYQDSYVEAIYTEAQTDYNPSERSYTDTENGEARINYIETSRNQWNSDGGNSTDGAKKYAGDRVYVDFLLTFGYKDLELSTLKSTDLQTGFVLEQVAELDKVEGKYKTSKESEYAAKYEGTAADKAAREEKVKAYIKDKNKNTYTDLETTHTFKMNSTIALTTLDNKNQCKHSVDMASKTLNPDGETLKDSPLKNYVYRAYSYVKLPNGEIQLSAPVYFTIYDVTTIANGAN